MQYTKKYPCSIFNLKIVDLFEKPSTTSTNQQFEAIGSFLDLMDQLLEGDQQKSTNMLDLSARVSSVIRHALTLSRVCHPADASEISLGKILYYC